VNYNFRLIPLVTLFLSIGTISSYTQTATPTFTPYPTRTPIPTPTGQIYDAAAFAEMSGRTGFKAIGNGETLRLKGAARNLHIKMDGNVVYFYADNDASSIMSIDLTDSRLGVGVDAPATVFHSVHPLTLDDGTADAPKLIFKDATDDYTELYKTDGGNFNILNYGDAGDKVLLRKTIRGAAGADDDLWGILFQMEDDDGDAVGGNVSVGEIRSVMTDSTDGTVDADLQLYSMTNDAQVEFIRLSGDDVEIRTGDLDVGITTTTAGTLQLFGDTSVIGGSLVLHTGGTHADSYTLGFPSGDDIIEFTTADSDDASLIIKNTGAGDFNLLMNEDANGDGPFQYSIWNKVAGNQVLDVVKFWYEEDVGAAVISTWYFSLDSIPTEVYGGTVVIDSIEIDGYTEFNALSLDYVEIVRNNGTTSVSVDKDNTDYGSGTSGAFSVTTAPTADVTLDSGYNLTLKIHWTNSGGFVPAEARIYKIIAQCHLE